MKTLIVLAFLLAATAAYAQFNGCPPGFCSGIRGFGGGGGGFSPNNNGGGGGVTPCSGTGLDFTVSCNSQYIGIL